MTIACTIDPEIDGPRARGLARQLLGMLGAPFGIGRTATGTQTVAIRPPGAPHASDATLTMHLGRPWDDPGAVRLVWRDDIPILYLAAGPAPDAFVSAGVVRADILGAVEFLTVGEQRAVTERDELGRFRASYSVLDDLGLASVAPLDRYATALRRLLVDRREDAWGGDRFLVALTHDVDGIFGTRPQRARAAHYLVTGLRTRDGTALEHAVSETARLIVRPTWGLPSFNFGTWSSFERELGVRATYHFFGDYRTDRHPNDAWYRYRERGLFDGRATTLGTAIGRLSDGGAEIGVHTSIRSFDDLACVEAERSSVERASGAPVISARAHYLRFDPQRSAPVFLGAGLRNDSSESGVGFTRGTGFPYRLLEAKDRDLVEIPTIVQDDHLLKGWRLGLPASLAMRRIERILVELAANGGGAAILFHPDQDEKLALYGWIIDWVRSQGGACVTTSELAERWRARSTPRWNE